MFSKVGQPFWCVAELRPDETNLRRDAKRVLTILILTTVASAQETASPPASKAIVHFYRERSYYGSIRKMPIFMDEQQIADLVNGRFFVAKLEPGSVS